MIKLKRKQWWVIAGVVGAGAVFVLVWFQPQKLLIEETVHEALPAVETKETAPEAPTESTELEAGPATLLKGSFQSLEHGTTGSAQILELADGSRFLRFEDLDTSNGPDLRVYLSEIPASDDWHAYGERFIDLGGLKGNRGDQNYALPEGLDLSRYKSAVIWCRRFTVGFGVAPLERA